MNKVRKFFRGSGRALALIFAASVVWLLFDMAALRLSFSDIHGRVPKEEVIRRERERLRGWRDADRSLERARGEPRQAPRGLGREEPYYRGSQEAAAAGAGNGLGRGERAGRRQGKEPAEGGGPPAGAPLGPAAAFKKRLPLPRTSPGKVQSPPAQPSVPMEKPARRAGSATDLPATKPALPRGAHAAAPERPLVKFAHSAATTASSPGAPPVAQGPRGRNEAGFLFKVAFGEKSSLAEFKRGALPAEETPESHQGLRAPADLPPVNQTGANGRLGQVTRSLEVPVAKPAASEAAAGQRGTSPGATGLGKASKAVEPSIAHAKVVPLAKDQVVIVSKEGAQVVLPTTQALPADAKGNVTHRSTERNVQLIDNKSSDKLKVMINATKVASLKASVAKGSLVEGTAHKVNLDDKAQLREINQSDSGIHLAEVRLHKVLAIDRSLVPRDPTAVGQFGRPAVVPGEKKEEAKRRWNEGNFNVYLSDLIPVDRAIEDTRPRG
ncbi:hypothetical protein lerEdw1_017474 [Lerista edwardsae]|nr:hypothetical protein lerEdw1_017474 [Lerista edwardsae]